MKTTHLFSIVALTSLAAATFSFASPLAQLLSPNKPPEGFHWRTDLISAHNEAVKTNQPLLIFISNDNCGYCSKMENSTLSDPDTLQFIHDEFIPVHLNIDDHMPVAEILEVKRIPCTIALNPRADLLGRIVGYVDPGQYLHALVQVRKLQDRIDRKTKSSIN